MKQPQNQGKSTELYKFFIAVNQPSLYRKKTACLDTDSRRRFSETLRTFTKTPQFGADVPDTSRILESSVCESQTERYGLAHRRMNAQDLPKSEVSLFQPLRVRYPRNLQVAWRRRFPRVGNLLKTLILSTLFHCHFLKKSRRKRQKRQHLRPVPVQSSTFRH